MSPWLLVPSRLVLFTLAQVLVAALFALTGHEAPWRDAGALWPLTASAVNVVSIAIKPRVESSRRPGSLKGDLLWLAGLLVILGPIGWLPNLALASLLYGDPNAPSALIIQPVAPWAAWVAAIAFPITVAFAELPTYFGVIRPRLEETLGATRAVLVSALALSLQHVALPLIFDARYLVWRGLMFLPFALLVGFVLRKRPTLMPWFMGVHALIDGATVTMQIFVSK